MHSSFGTIVAGAATLRFMLGMQRLMSMPEPKCTEVAAESDAAALTRIDGAVVCHTMPQQATLQGKIISEQLCDCLLAAAVLSAKH